MHIPVLVERVNGNGYRARGFEPMGLFGEGATRDEAIAKLRDACQAKLQEGAELLELELTPAPHPWMEFAGMFKDSPDFDEVVKIMEENRRKMDADPDER